VISRQPFTEPDSTLSLLRVYAARAAAELERQSTESDLVRARDTAERANQSKTDFLANMSHEIRTPMTAILGFTDLMREDATGRELPPHWLQHLQTIQDHGQVLLAILNDILDLSKIEAGKMSVEHVAVAPDLLVRDVVQLLRPRATEKGLELTAVWTTPVPVRIAGDPVRLRQILVNLVGNAIKFTASGSVTVRIRFDDDDPAMPRLCFAVADTGIGIGEQQLQRLFAAFEQADTSTTRRFGGTGLGLQISRRLARLMGGDITVASAAGAGSTFTLSVPTGPCGGVPSLRLGADAAATTKDLPAATAMPSLLAGVRVLVVDDGPDNRRLLAAILERAGALVTAVDGARAAFTELGPQPPAAPFDVVLMDVQMPEIDGLMAVRTLRDQGFSLPILAVTANAMARDRDACFAAGCNGFATKPIDRKRLVVAVREAVDRVRPD
jgi:signal transduction histidine kinase/ActR/RegA family two-component response regulator